MEDIAPVLLNQIKKDFQSEFDKSKIISSLYEKIRDGTATYAEANDFAVEVGDILARVYKKNLSSAVLPDGKMHYNIAKRVIDPTMTNNYDIISAAATQVQAVLNKSANIGIKAITPKLNQDRIDKIIDRVSDEDVFDDIAWILNEPVKNFSQSIVDDSIKVNSEFHAKSGMTPKIVRKIAGSCCEWCRIVAGTYTYPDVPDDVYRRHQRCRCTVDYHPGDGRFQNVHTKEWQNPKNSDKMKSRKNIGLEIKKTETPQEREKRIEVENGLGLAEIIVAHPKMFQAYTPQRLKEDLEKAGYDVMPLSRGKYKGVLLEDGGGFKVNYGGNGLLQYHPEKGSHHNGAYYKISSGKGGIHRYDTNGNEIEKNGNS